MNFIVILLLHLIKYVYSQSCECGELIPNNGISSEEISNIVNIHNLYRACIALGQNSQSCQDVNVTDQNQPQAANMKELIWDDYLAEQAQIWADNCKFQHNYVDDSRFSVGQNLARFSFSSDYTGSSPDFYSVIRLWFDEQRIFLYHHLTEQDFETKGDNQIGHYTQVTWANTYMVGCGYSYYKGTDDWYNKLYVCNYGPSGNYLEETPYKIGEPNCQAYGLKNASTLGLCTSTPEIPDGKDDLETKGEVSKQQESVTNVCGLMSERSLI